jgi:hypothetical protein
VIGGKRSGPPILPNPAVTDLRPGPASGYLRQSSRRTPTSTSIWLEAAPS